jgi:capsular polysaccharide biosynthesis protein
MNLSESLHTLRKRWILTLLLLVLAGAATAVAAAELPKSYQSTATVTLLASKADSKLYYNSNPYLAFDDSLNVAADVVGRRMMDPTIVSALAAQGYTSSYQVEDAPTSPGPVLIITVTGKDPTNAQSTLQGVTDALAAQLSAMQSDVSAQNRITDTVLSSSLKASLSVSKMARPIAAVVVVSLVLAFSIPLIVEGISVRRRTRNKKPLMSKPSRGPEDSIDDAPSTPSPSSVHSL